MTDVVITRNDRSEAAGADVDIDLMRFPVRSREALGIFTEAAHGRRLDSAHA
jgi:hypothetical protein